MTYSIVAHDPVTGNFGVATATGGPAVGALVPHLSAGFGAIATQGDTNPYYGFDGLAFLQEGLAPALIVEKLTAKDVGSAFRQLLVIGPTGGPAGFSGDQLEPVSGAVLRDHFGVAGNMLRNDGVLNAAADAFAGSDESLPLHQRLLLAMQAGEKAGGDKRDTRSAALLVCSDQSYLDIDCRVDFSTTPIADLAAVLHACTHGEHGQFMAQRPRIKQGAARQTKR